jgi:superfamily II DNA or RNA helicase
VTIVIRKTGNLIDVSEDGSKGLPDEYRRLLEPILRYEKMSLLYGASRYDPATGEKLNKQRFDTKQCYRYDAFGRMITSFGFSYRIHDILKKNGVTPELTRAARHLPRPDAYRVELKNVSDRFAYRPKQEECLMSLIAKPCGIIHAVTGFGKLVMLTMACLAFPYAKIAVVTKRARLVNKIRSFLTQYIPNVGQIGGAEGKNVMGDRVTVYTCASLHKADYDVDFLFVDEGHEAVAESYSKMFARFIHSRNYAFTATPRGRIDGTDIRIEALFGPTIFYISYPEALKLGLVVPVRVEWTDVILDDNPCAGLEDIKKKRAGIWCNERRNKIIAAKANTFEPDEQTLILTETIEHAVHLGQFLPDYSLVYDDMKPRDFKWYKDHGYLKPDEPVMTPRRKEDLRVAFEKGKLKKAIATGVWAVGIDPTQLAAVGRAEGSDSEIMDQQAPGRVTRTHGVEKKVGIVFDFKDQFDGGLRRRAVSRQSHYAHMKWDQVTTSNAEVLEDSNEAD